MIRNITDDLPEGYSIKIIASYLEEGGERVAIFCNVYFREFEICVKRKRVYKPLLFGDWEEKCEKATQELVSDARSYIEQSIKRKEISKNLFSSLSEL